MEVITEVLLRVLHTALHDKQLAYAFLFIVIVGLLFLLNIILGTIIGGHSEGFDIKKFLFGFLKGIAICITLFTFCIIVNVFFVGLNDMGTVQVDTKFVSVAEIILMIVAQGQDIIKEVLEKFKSIRPLKYEKYEDYKVPDYNEANAPEELG